MLNDRSYTRTFFSAPQSVTSFVAAVSEPLTTVGVLLAVLAIFGQPLSRAEMVLCLMVFALSFPGRNRFHDSRLEAGVDIFSSWLRLVMILWLCAYATGSLGFFDLHVIASWCVLTPLMQWFVVLLGRTFLRHRAQLPGYKRKVVVLMAGPLGGKDA